MKKGRGPSARARLLLRIANAADARRARTLRLSRKWGHARLGVGGCFRNCDPKARKSANVSQIATPRLGNLRMFHRLRPQGSAIGECFADCCPKARKSGGLTASLAHWPTNEKFKRKPCVREASNCERHCRHVLQGSRNVSKRRQHVLKGLALHLWAVPQKPKEASMRKGKNPSACARLLLRTANIADARRARALRLSRTWGHARLGMGGCFKNCDPKVRKSANVSQIATPRFGNRRMLHRLRPQGSEIGACFTDCDPKVRKPVNVSQIAAPRFENLCMFRRLRPQGSEIGRLDRDADSLANQRKV